MEKRPIRDRWPTVEEQLAESHVISGSALEQLIKENQDVALLNPAELNDPGPFSSLTFEGLGTIPKGENV